jgi:hypothetical protein
MPRRFQESTFLFVFGHPGTEPCEDDRRLLGVMRRLGGKGATVKVICQPHSPLVGEVRALGFEVVSYRLDQWNWVRTRSRVRKFLKRYDVPVAHSTGRWGNILLGLAARPLPNVHVVMSMWCGGAERAGRAPKVARELELRRALGRADLVLTRSERRKERLTRAGVDPRNVVDYPGELDDDGLIERYRDFLRR